MKNKYLLLSLAITLTVAGCTSTSSQHDAEKPPPKASRVQVLTYDTTPRPKTDHLDFCGMNPPQKPYKVIALLTCEGAMDQEVVMTTAIYYRARQMGAEGVMNAGTITTRNTLNVAGTPANMLAMNALGIGASGGRSIFRAYAIVYTPPTESDTKTATELIGHWATVSIKGASAGVTKMELTFLPGNKLVGVTTQNAKTYPLNGRYFVQDGKLAIAEDKQLRPDMLDFSLVGDYLTVSLSGGEKATLKRSSD